MSKTTTTTSTSTTATDETRHGWTREALTQCIRNCQITAQGARRGARLYLLLAQERYEAASTTTDVTCRAAYLEASTYYTRLGAESIACDAQLSKIIRTYQRQLHDYFGKEE